MTGTAATVLKEHVTTSGTRADSVSLLDVARCTYQAWDAMHCEFKLFTSTSSSLSSIYFPQCAKE